MLACERSARSRNSAASNFGMMIEVAPRAMQGRKNAPEACAIGAACRKVSPGRMSGTRSIRNAESSASSPRVVKVTALALPVVPPVKPRRYGASSARSTAQGRCSPRAISASSSSGPIKRSARRPSMPAWITARAPLSSILY